MAGLGGQADRRSFAPTLAKDARMGHPQFCCFGENQDRGGWATRRCMKLSPRVGQPRVKFDFQLAYSKSYRCIDSREQVSYGLTSNTVPALYAPPYCVVP